QNLRQIDLVGRYGGEEFSVILTETDKTQAELVAERIRKTIADKQVRVYDEQLKATLSIGISIFPETAGDVQSLIDNADQALYQAKLSGRNKVLVYGECKK
ncbi:MAG TPA: GGDEF domain-containing protein, partial [Candidatus Omnitrophota bacterium]|nr:GGDEF domain-containing protein [Candidatus Omnitrophota bacterium]